MTSWGVVSPINPTCRASKRFCFRTADVGRGGKTPLPETSKGPPACGSCPDWEHVPVPARIVHVFVCKDGKHGNMEKHMCIYRLTVIMIRSSMFNLCFGGPNLQTCRKVQPGTGEDPDPFGTTKRLVDDHDWLLALTEIL